MPEDERTLRMNYLRRREKANDVNFWMKSFMKQMGSQIEEDTDEVISITMHPLTMDDFEDYLAK
jgi:trehalose 6-phosphate synthase/phosphatase